MLRQVGAFCVIAAAEHSLFRALATPAPVIRYLPLATSYVFVLYILFVFVLFGLTTSASPYELVMALKVYFLLRHCYTFVTVL